MYKIINYDKPGGAVKAVNEFSNIVLALFMLPAINGDEDYKELVDDTGKVLYKYIDGKAKQVYSK